MAKKTKIVKEKSIEDRIWDSANKLRGNLTASEYQNVVLKQCEQWTDNQEDME